MGMLIAGGMAMLVSGPVYGPVYGPVSGAEGRSPFRLGAVEACLSELAVTDDAGSPADFVAAGSGWGSGYRFEAAVAAAGAGCNLMPAG
jgi:hypothetical protein